MSVHSERKNLSDFEIIEDYGLVNKKRKLFYPFNLDEDLCYQYENILGKNYS